MSQPPLSLLELEGTVAATVLDDARRLSETLTTLCVPHALIGGLAVGLYGHPRATKDVDFLVGPQAFESMHPFLVYREELKDVVQMGVVDLLAPPEHRGILLELIGVPNPGEIPVIPVAGLVLMKLDASRPQDTADVHSLLNAGANAMEIGAFLVLHAPDLADRFAAILDERGA